MKIFFLLLYTTLLGLAGFRPLTETTLSGVVTDLDSKEPLLGAVIKVNQGHKLVKGTVTDAKGNYSLRLDAGTYEVEFIYTGYTTQRITGVQVVANQKNTLDVTLSGGAVLDEYVVTSYKEPLIKADDLATGTTLAAKSMAPRSEAGAPKMARKKETPAAYSAPMAKTAVKPVTVLPPPSTPASTVDPATLYDPATSYEVYDKTAAEPEGDVTPSLPPGEDRIEIDGVMRRVRTVFAPETYEERIEILDEKTGEPIRDKDGDPEKERDAVASKIPEQPTPRAGLLTAGEWNDLHNWNNHWLDLLADGEINQYQNLYGFFPKNRFAVLLTNDQDFPVADAVVQLRTAAGEIIWESRTDNTGKAELWAGLFNQKDSTGLQAVAIVNGQQHDLGQPNPAKDGLNRHQIKVDCQAPKNVDIVWAVDATGSMGDEIEYLKTELLDVIGRAKSHNPELAFRMGTVFYRDQGDEYLTKSSGLSPDIARTVEFISKQFAGGGGDYPEAVHSALEEAIFGQKWSEQAIARICFLVLDASPHQSPEVNASLQRSIREAARLGIRIVPVTASGIQKDTEFLMKFFGLATNGSYVFLTDHSGIGGKHIEPTTDEYKVELLNDLLVRLITEYTTIKTCTGQSAIRFEDPQAQPNQPATWQALYYPNPASTQFTLDLPFEVQSVTIYNAEGQAVRKLEKAQAGLNTVNISDLAPGFYTIRILKDGRMQSGKLMVVRN